MLQPPERRTRLSFDQWKALIERVAGDLNPILIVVAVGLAILNVSCYAALELGRRYPSLNQPEPPPGLEGRVG